MNNNWIASLLVRIWTQVTGLYASLRPLNSKLDQIIASMQVIQQTQVEIMTGFEITQNELLQILTILTPPVPVAFLITISANTIEGEALNQKRIRTQGDNAMAGQVLKATLDFQLNDNGTATATATPIDAAGLPTTLPAGTATPVWASSAPSVVVTPVATDPTGLSATIAPAVPPVLATAVNVTLTAALASGTSISGSDLVDVVSSAAVGFAIAMN